MDFTLEFLLNICINITWRKTCVILNFKFNLKWFMYKYFKYAFILPCLLCISYYRRIALLLIDWRTNSFLGSRCHSSLTLKCGSSNVLQLSSVTCVPAFKLHFFRRKTFSAKSQTLCQAFLLLNTCSFIISTLSLATAYASSVVSSIQLSHLILCHTSVQI